jgi:hypothetical protein
MIFELAPVLLFAVLLVGVGCAIVWVDWPWRRKRDPGPTVEDEMEVARWARRHQPSHEERQTRALERIAASLETRNDFTRKGPQ